MRVQRIWNAEDAPLECEGAGEEEDKVNGVHTRIFIDVFFVAYRCRGVSTEDPSSFQKSTREEHLA